MLIIWLACIFPWLMDFHTIFLVSFAEWTVSSESIVQESFPSSSWKDKVCCAFLHEFDVVFTQALLETGRD